MQEMYVRELEKRAGASDHADEIHALEARARVVSEIEKMRAEGKVHVLADEEVELIASFRRFKLRMRKPAEMFTWQTRRPDSIELVEQTAEVILPREA